MFHKRKEFVFYNNKGEPVKFISSPFNFEIDDYLKDRFGEVKSDEITINLNDAKKDFGVLLQDESGRNFDEKLHNIDLRKQDYDLILEVYAFFLMYKKNAYLRQLKYNSETLAFEIEQAKKILSSMPEIISKVTQKKGFGVS